jgi:hypothetical protein
MPRDRRVAGIAVRYVALVVVVLLVAGPLYVFVEGPWRATVVRLASALVLGIALLEIRSALARRLEGPESALDEERFSTAPGAEIPQRFLSLRGDVRAGLRSRRRFQQGLWPQLTALAARPLTRPPFRRGRGPSVQGLRAVIAELEALR